MKAITSLSSLLAACLFSFGVSAADVPAQDGALTERDASAAMFDALDQDKNGLISTDEAKRSADAKARFQEIDVDHDGQVSLAEWKRAHKAM